MNVYGVAMVKDEADILRYTVEHLLNQGVDHVFIIDNLSTDGTVDLLLDLEDDGQVSWETDREVGYYQAQKMTKLVHSISAERGDWIVPFDADEAWYLPMDDLEQCGDVIILPSYVYLPQPTDDAGINNPIERMRWRMSVPEQYPKVMFRYTAGSELHMGNHDVTQSEGSVRVPYQGVCIRHYQYRSLDQVRRKVQNGVAAYTAAPELAGHFGAHWRWLASLDDAGLEAWWNGYIHLTETTFDP